MVRSQFKESDRQDQEKVLTYVIRHSEMQRTERNGTMVHGVFERAVNFILFDWTCQYGMSPIQAALVAAWLAVILSIVYIFAQLDPGPKGGLWAVWDKDRVRQDEGSEDAQRLSYGFPYRRCDPSFIYLALYFSFLSAARIGWQGVNLGAWLTRMQSREYTLKATGWVRVVSGIQSFISICLVVLAILSYTGTPFE